MKNPKVINMKLLSKFKKGAIVSAFLLASLTSTVAAADEVAVLILDTQVVMEKSKAIESIRTQLNAKAEDFKNDSTKKEAYFKKKFDELESKKSALSKDAYDKKAQELNNEFNEAQKKVQKDRASLDKAYADAMQIFEENLKSVIKEKAKEKTGKKIVVLPEMQTLYSDDSLNITADVVEKLNKKISTIDVKFE